MNPMVWVLFGLSTLALAAGLPPTAVDAADPNSDVPHLAEAMHVEWVARAAPVYARQRLRGPSFPTAGPLLFLLLVVLALTLGVAAARRKPADRLPRQDPGVHPAMGMLLRLAARWGGR